MYVLNKLIDFCQKETEMSHLTLVTKYSFQTEWKLLKLSQQNTKGENKT